MSKTWIQIYGDWSLNLFPAKGFVTVESIEGQHPSTELTRRDLVLAKMGDLLVTWATIAEAIRKGDQHRAASLFDYLHRKSNDIVSIIESSSLSQQLRMSNAEVMIGKLVMVGTEVAEAIEDVQTQNLPGFTEEVADTFIRLISIVAGIKVDMDTAVHKKMEANEQRRPKHGKLSLL